MMDVRCDVASPSALLTLARPGWWLFVSLSLLGANQLASAKEKNWSWPLGLWSLRRGVSVV